MGLYVHIPFCVSRCRYCDFASTAGLPRGWQARYREALRKEYTFYQKGAAAGARWGTVYFGGGTPTYLDEDLLEGMITDLLQGGEDSGGGVAQGAPGRGGETLRQGAAPDWYEFTVEANPGTLTEGKLAMLRKAGCGRLSIGAQSFDDRYLAWLGRRHDAAAFRRAWEAARKAGFANMNLDLLYGLPGQSADHWRRSLSEALAFQPEHISLYQLNIEPGTALARLAETGQTCTADEETCRSQYLLAHQILGEAGYLHYEISNYALPGRESRHNSRYWRNGYYLGLGAGAAGYLPGFRYTNKAGLEEYLTDLGHGAAPVAEWEGIDEATAETEELMLAFRLREGVGKGHFRLRRGFDMREKYGRALEKHLAAGLLEEDEEAIRPTLEGWLQYNQWIQDFMP
jgi:oxygen-independent coproporphyrinogen-3 oxidase